MTSKLNLTIDENIARQIKAYAAKKKVSVSNITEAYYEALLNADKKLSSLTAFLDKYAGSIKRETPIDIKKEKEDYLNEKYGL